MRVLYFDARAGASGDMIVGALVDLAGGQRAVRDALGAMGLPGVRVSFRTVRRGGIAGLKFSVQQGRPQPHRGLREILRLLRRTGLPPTAQEFAEAVFRRLVAAESRIHRIPPEKIHLHEVGAVDSIADVTAAAICLARLAPARVLVSPLPLGGGVVDCAHGRLPVPAPATLELLRDAPVHGGPVAVETVTPTGAAILMQAAAGFGPVPAMRLGRVGMGAGDRDIPGLPNLLRVLEGDDGEPAEIRGEVVVVEAALDDLNPQVYGHLMQVLLDAGALEVFYTPVQMKKGRPGVQLTVIGRPEALDPLCRLVLRETTTLGLRFQYARRWELPRESVRVRTRFGPVRVKVARLDGDEVTAAPEYEDCRALAVRRGVPLRAVQAEAIRAYWHRREEGR